MNAAQLPTLTPLLPEFVLGIGAMALLLIGVFRGEQRRPFRRRRRHRGSGRRRRDSALAAARQAHDVQRQFRRRRFCPLPENSGAARLGRRHRDVARLCAARAAGAVRIFGADPALDARHADADFGCRSDRALSRPRIDEPAALRGGGQPSRRVAVDRSGAEIFRPRRAVVGHAALWRVACVRLHRHRELRRYRARGRAGRHRLDFRHRVPVRRFLFQGFRGAVPHVDAGRLSGRADTGHGLFRLRAEGRRHRDVRTRCGRGLPRHHVGMAADRGLRLDRLHGARLLRRYRPAQHQTPDGLFVDRPHGLCA